MKFIKKLIHDKFKTVTTSCENLQMYTKENSKTDCPIYSIILWDLQNCVSLVNCELPNCVGSHITLQLKTGFPLKLNRAEPGQYLDGRPPGKTRLLLEEVLVRPAGGAHPVVCVGLNTSV